jgi:hypothetical protein
MKLAIFPRNGDLEEPPAKVSSDHLVPSYDRIRKKELRLWRRVAWAAFGSNTSVNLKMINSQLPTEM